MEDSQVDQYQNWGVSHTLTAMVQPTVVVIEVHAPSQSSSWQPGSFPNDPHEITQKVSRPPLDFIFAIL